MYYNIELLKRGIREGSKICNDTKFSNKKKIDNLYHLHIIRLRILGMIDTCDMHAELGKFYGYSKCCITNFISLSMIGVNPNAYMDKVLQFNDIPKISVGYVRCLECSIKGRIGMLESSLSANGWTPRGKTGFLQTKVS